MSTNWQDKIFNHEETPPKGAWENIAKMLDEADATATPTPPPIKKTTKIIYWRIAAAACIIAMIATTAVWLNSDKKPDVTDPDFSNTVAKKSTEVKSISPANQQNILPINVGESSSTAVSKKTTPIISTTDKTDISKPIEYAKVNAVESLAKDPALNKTEKLTNTGGDVPNDIALMNTPNNYVSFIGPNGQEVKVSSKFSNLLGYMDGKEPESEEYLDKIINESNFWRGKFKAWRNKMINNNVAPSPSNFMDIIELSKLLQEDK